MRGGRRRGLLGFIQVVAAILASLALVWTAPAAQAISPPVIDPAAVAANEPPTPPEELESTGPCAEPGLIAGTDLGAPPGPQAFMNLPALWSAAGSKGAGVKVGMIDTGVNPSPRLHVSGAGDYVVKGGDGLQDCDSHGTVIASIIAGQPSEADGFSGVAPDAELVSIRQSSSGFRPAHPSGGGDQQAERRAGTITGLAKSLRVLADTPGVKVINMSVVACIPVLKPVDQTVLGATIRYAAVDKNIVLVAAAGNIGAPDCAQNPDIDPGRSGDSRNWSGVVTESAPGWFSDYVLTVSATDVAGQPAVNDKQREMSLFGPWIGVGAPGLFVSGFNERGEIINDIKNQDGLLMSLSGTSFSAAYVSGVAALIRAMKPDLSAAQVIQRIKLTAHSPAAGVDNRLGYGVVDNRVGYGVIDPLAALTWQVNEGPERPAEHLDMRLVLPPPPAPKDYTPEWVAGIGSLALLTVVGAGYGVRRMAGAKTPVNGGNQK